MNKAELKGYLYALKDFQEDGSFDDFDDSAEWIIDRILEKVNTLEEPIQTQPFYPWHDPWILYEPGSTEIKFGKESNYKIEYPDKITVR